MRETKQCQGENGEDRISGTHKAVYAASSATIRTYLSTFLMSESNPLRRMFCAAVHVRGKVSFRMGKKKMLSGRVSALARSLALVAGQKSFHFRAL